MAQSVKEKLENKMDKSPERSENSSPPQSPFQPFLDADVASILSRSSPQKGEATVPNTESSSPQKSEAAVPSTESQGSFQNDIVTEKKADDVTDSNAPDKSSTVLSEDKDSSSGTIPQNINKSNPNGSTSLSKETESLDKDTSHNADLNVPLFCVTITEGTEAIFEKGIETETIALNNYREEEEIDSDDSSDGSDSSSDCSDSFLYEMRRSVKYTPAPMTYNVKPEDNSYGDLPAIEDLDINVEESEVAKIGVVEYIVGLEAVIKSKDGLKPLQLDSVLFLSNQKPLGKVCDVYGPVKQPYYSVRFNSKEHLKKVGVEKGNDVYYAPDRKEITEYVFFEELQKQKGSDASGRNDNEPSDENLDFSDDEKEKEAKLRRKKSKQARAKDSRRETGQNNKDPPTSNKPAENPFFSMKNKNNTETTVKNKPNWTPLRASSSSYSRPPREQFQSNNARNNSENFSQTPRHHAPPNNYRMDLHPPQPSPFQPPHYQQPDQSPYQPPSPLVRLQFRLPPQKGPIHFPPPSPLPYQQTMGYSQGGIHQQQHQPPIGPPRPISLQQMHMFGQMTPLGPMSPAPHLSYPPNVASPPPSTAFPPASPNFSYFSHPFPSAPSPAPGGSQSWGAPPSPGGMQVMPPMSPLSIQIPNNVRSTPPPTVVANGYQGYGYQNNRNLLQQNVGANNQPTSWRYV